MNLDEAIRILTEHNKWRRAEPPYDGLPDGSEPRPREIGGAIDYAVEELQKNERVRKINEQSNTGINRPE